MATKTSLACACVLALAACGRSLPDDGRVDADPPYTGYPRVSAGAGKTCLLDAAGRVLCWGNLTPGDEVPDKVFADIDVSLRGCGLERDGGLTCWPKSTDVTTPGVYPEGRYSRVSTDAFHACAVRLDGRLACWGESSFGMTDPPQGKFRDVSVGETHACAIRADGTLACWGINTDGQASPPPGAFTSVSSGAQHSCAQNIDGVVACWGAASTFGSLHRRIVRSVRCGYRYTCVIHLDGILECTGVDDKLSQPPSGRFAQMDIGLDHACAVRADGTVACWGQNYSGQATPPAR